jgi:hypothetical protein
VNDLTLAGLCELARTEGPAAALDRLGGLLADPSDRAPGLAWIRLGLTRRLLDDAVEYLRGRDDGATVLLNLPMVRGLLAEAVGTWSEARVLIEAGQELPWAHQRLTDADRTCLRLFGASGYVVGGPGSLALASEELADPYLAYPEEVSR